MTPGAQDENDMRSTQTNRINGLVCFLTTGLMLGGLASARAQEPQPGGNNTHAGQIATQQQEKARDQHGASVMGEAGGCVLPATGHRLDARRLRATAGRTVGKHEPRNPSDDA